MDAIYRWGLDFVRAVQSHADPALTVAMQVLSLLGGEYAYLLAVPVLYWCWDAKKAFRLGVVIVLSAWANGALKDLLALPRPYNLDPSVALSQESSYGFPSNHAQQALVFWAFAASWLRRPWGYVLAVAAVLAVSFSRIYLGMHFPTDVLGGWLLGSLFLGCYFLFGEKLARPLAAANARVPLLVVVFAAYAMNALHSQDVAMGGGLLGLGLGYLLMSKRFPYDASLGADGGGLKLRTAAARLGFGLMVAFALYAGLKLASRHLPEEVQHLMHFARYAAAAFWISAGAPFAFQKLGLAADARR